MKQGRAEIRRFAGVSRANSGDRQVRRRVLVPGRLATMLFASIIAALLSGCGDYGGRLPVSGTVTFEGEPLDKGFIMFNPLDPGGLSSGGEIVDGGYSLSGESGLPLGKYKVMIFSPDDSKEIALEQVGGAEGMILAKPSPERIPPAFNSESTLTVDFASPDEGVFDFAIPKSAL